MRKKQITLLVIMCLGFFAMGPGIAQAETWTKMPTLSGSLGFTLAVDGGYLVPAPCPVEGCWLEEWNGTKGGSATLEKLWFSGEVPDYMGQLAGPEAVDPTVKYNNGSYLGIVVPYDWTMQVPNNMYSEGYRSPYTTYNYPSVKGYVQVYAPETLQIYMSTWKSWRQ